VILRKSMNVVFLRNSTDSHRWWSSKEPEDAVDKVGASSVVAVVH